MNMNRITDEELQVAVGGLTAPDAPLRLLATALVLATAGVEVAEDGPPDEVGVFAPLADAYTRIADTLIRARADERAQVTHRMLLDDADQHGADLAAEDEAKRQQDRPKPARGRFTATLVGSPLGLIGDEHWHFVPGHGFLAVSAAYATPGRDAVPDEHGDVSLTLTGRVVSGTPDQILGITDGGISVALPRALVTIDEEGQ